MLTPKKLLLSTLFAAITCTGALNAQAKELTVGLAVANDSPSEQRSEVPSIG